MKYGKYVTFLQTNCKVNGKWWLSTFITNESWLVKFKCFTCGFLRTWFQLLAGYNQLANFSKQLVKLAKYWLEGKRRRVVWREHARVDESRWEWRDWIFNFENVVILKLCANARTTHIVCEPKWWKRGSIKSLRLIWFTESSWLD